MLFRIRSRAVAKCRRILAAALWRRPCEINLAKPLVSFSFDDAPLTAFTSGGAILEDHDVRGTYYLSLGLLSTHTELGPIANAEDVLRAVGRRHELGCHTFDHHDAWMTSKRTFLDSIEHNRHALAQLLPGHQFKTFAYPKNGALANVKPPLGRQFDCCRGGGQMFNTGRADLNLLKACFLDRRARLDMSFVRTLIERNAQSRGWLIFAAHDISQELGDFSCSPDFFEAVVRHAIDSGANVLPVAEAYALVSAVPVVGRTHASAAHH